MSKQFCIKILSTTMFLTFFQACSHKKPQETEVKTPEPVQAKFITISLAAEAPIVGTTAKGTPIYIGGFSALQFINQTKEGDLYFWTITDRGPNANHGDGRPFLVPEYSPRIYKLRWNVADGSLKITDEIILKDSQGKPLTGLPNMPKADEKPVDEEGKALSYDLLGIDSEGLAQDKEGNFWVCDEYRPSVFKFDSTGKLIKRFVPKGAFSKSDLKKIEKEHGPTPIVEAFPMELSFRQKNRGFEGLAIKGDHLVVTMQSPLRLPGAQNKLLVRVFEFDIKSEALVATYIYPINSKQVDKIGDVAWTDEGLFFIEQNSDVGEKGVHRLYKVEKPVRYENLHPKAIPERFSNEELKDVLMQKELVLDFVATGFDSYEKLEGLSILPDGRVVVVIDNDFGLSSNEKNETVIDPKKRPVVAIFPKISK